MKHTDMIHTRRDVEIKQKNQRRASVIAKREKEKGSTRKSSTRMWSGKQERSEKKGRLWSAESIASERSDGGFLIHLTFSVSYYLSLCFFIRLALPLLWIKKKLWTKMGNGDLLSGLFPPAGPTPRAICFVLNRRSDRIKSLPEPAIPLQN